MMIAPLGHLHNITMLHSIFSQQPVKMFSSEMKLHALLHPLSHTFFQMNVKILPMSFTLQHQLNLRTMTHQLQLLDHLLIQIHSLQLHLVTLGELILHHGHGECTPQAGPHSTQRPVCTFGPAGNVNSDHKAKGVW